MDPTDGAGLREHSNIDHRTGQLQEKRRRSWIFLSDAQPVMEQGMIRDCSPDLVIRGEEGSEAERYAAENGIKFEIWEENDRIGEGNLPC